jgi:hypothetical protein
MSLAKINVSISGPLKKFVLSAYTSPNVSAVNAAYLKN